MRGLQKSKRVSWASDLNLCQVKLFLSDESPSQVGLSGQDHLQAKESWHSDDNLPPGFEGIQPANLFQNKLSQITLIQWKCPSRFILDPNWQVTAGEESKEVDFESQREMRILEAVYPRPSAIPPNPASPIHTDNSPYNNDHHTPLIPITPIEDEDTSPATSSIPPPPPPTTTNHMSNGMAPPGIEPDVMNAAYNALTTAMSSSQGNLIDPNLLIKILSTPTLIEKLVSSHGPPLPPITATTTTTTTQPPSSSSGGPLYPQPPRSGGGAVSVSGPAESGPGRKDLSYYKSLIQQHGGEKGEQMMNNNNVKTKGKVMKTCIYYNSTRGCRHGANCIYQHDSSISSSSSSTSSVSQQRVSMPEAQTAKRMKMDSREITGT
ncbi:hypothetical protein Lser_V15G36790 [Lactuca serriola]